MRRFLESIEHEYVCDISQGGEMDISLTSDTSVFKLDKSDVPILRRLGGSLELILHLVVET